MSQPPIKVMCVDDSERLIAAWSRLFERQPDLKLIASLDSADQLVERAQDCRPDVVLMDLTMAGRDPLEAMEQLAQEHPEIRVIVCTGHSDPALVERAVDAGAWGFLAKMSEPNQILDAIRTVAGGKMVIPSGM